MGDVNGVSGWRTNAIEVGNESSVDCGISEVAFHHAELALSTFFPSVELDSLALYHLEFTLMCSISVYVSNNTRVFEIYNGIVDEESRHRRGMEDVEVVVLDPKTVKIGRGMCTCMKGNGVLGIPLLVDPYNVSVNSNLPKSDISCYFVLPILIEKDEGVLPCITTVVLTPPNSWMVRVIKLFGELGNVGDGARSGGERNGGVIRSKSDWFVALNIIVCHVTLNLVKNLRDEEKVFDGGVVMEGGGEDLVVKLSVP